MTTFAQRNRPHQDAQDAIHVALELRGLRVERTGWETLTGEQQDHMTTSWPGRLRRWWPDMKVTLPDSSYVYADVKTSSLGDAWSIELAALAMYGLIEARLGVMVVVIFRDMTCNYATDLVPSHVQTRPFKTKNGSGTAYALVPKRDQLPIDVMF